jgi:mRNA-degrading endonuclease toxin of MazEF toxin-antitoxin module
MNLLLSAIVIRYAVASPMERLLLAPATSGAATSASEILLPPVNQTGQPKHPIEIGVARLRGLHLELLVRPKLVQQLGR